MVGAESIARGDARICSSFTEKAIAASMNACYGDMYICYTDEKN